MTKKEASEILDILDTLYPDAHCELVHKTPFELLVATILSAQCTDIRVNEVTSEMFLKYNQPKDFATMDQRKLEKLIHSCGFYRNKAKNIIAAAKIIDQDYHGKVPETIQELVKLPGVGKKTANVVASTCFNVPAIAVDTHVFRVSNRIGFVDENNVEKTEAALQRKIEKNRWTKAHHLFIFHGRRMCSARNPNCQLCPLTDRCRFYLRSGKWSS